MPKKITPQSQAKSKTLFLQYPFLTIFNSKKVSCKQIYSNGYNYAIYLKLLVFLRALNIQ